jgi:hypothetical protein
MMAILWQVSSSEIPLMMRRLQEREKQPDIPTDWAEQDFLRGQKPVMEHGVHLLLVAFAVVGLLALGIAAISIIVLWANL